MVIDAGRDAATVGRRGPFQGLREGWQRTRPLIGDGLAAVIALAVASICAGLAEAGVLGLVAEVAATMVLHGHRIHASLGVKVNIGVGTALVIALVLAGGRLLLGLVIAWLPAQISADVQAKLRRELFDAYTRASWKVQSDESEGHLQELMTNQIMQATQSVLNLTALITAGVMFLTIVAVAFALNVFVAMVVLASAVALFGLLRPLARRGRLAARDLSQANIDHAGGVSEAVWLSEEAQVFGMGAAQRKRVGKLIETSRKAYFRFLLTGRLVQSGYQSLVILLIVGGLAGLYLVGPTDVAALGAVVLMLTRASSYSQSFQSSYHLFNQMQPYLDRLERATTRYSRSAVPDGGRPLLAIRSLAFEAVSFGYKPDRPVLQDVTFEVHAGEATGIVGPTGAGKSTIVQLLLQLREPESGGYLVNGALASEFIRTDWQRRVAYVSQESRLYHGTVADNIRFFRELDQAAVEQAARLAHIHDDITRMSSGYDTVIGQRADAVSGGQRQRICLARALAELPDVLVLDEPTSSLDLASEAAVQRSLADLHGRVTLFIVAHRLSLLRHCDRVIVLEAGRLRAFDAIAELERSNPFYRRAVSLMAGGPSH